MHDWDVKVTQPFSQFKIGGKTSYVRKKLTERLKFVQFLADGLPYRTLYSVHHRFRNLYESNVRGR